MRSLPSAALLVLAAHVTPGDASAQCADGPDIGLTTSAFTNFPWGGAYATYLVVTGTPNDVAPVGATLFFDLQVAQDCYLESFAIGVDGPAGERILGDVYHTPLGGGYAGLEVNRSAWLAATHFDGVTANPGAITNVAVAEPLWLPAGQYGIAIVCRDFSFTFRQDATAPTFSNTLATLHTGAAVEGAFDGGLETTIVPRLRLNLRADANAGTNMRYQLVVSNADLGGPGPITGLAFAPSRDGRHWSRALQVRMSHVPPGYTLTSLFQQNMPAPQNVLLQQNHTWTCYDDAWSELGMDTPFSYDGVSDLVVEVIIRGSMRTDGATNGMSLRALPTYGQRAYATGWTGPTPTVATSLATSGNVFMPNVRLTRSCARVSRYGATCGSLRATWDGSGQRGTDFKMIVEDVQASPVAFLALGFQLPTTAGVPLDFLGWDNCLLSHAPVTLETLGVDPNDSAAWSLTIPNDPALDGAHLYGQWLTLDPSEPGEVALSDMIGVMFGV